MRKIIVYQTAREFLNTAESFLEQNEAENNLLLGWSYRLIEKPNSYGSMPFFAIVENNHQVEIVALMTPPKSLIIYSDSTTPIESFDFLAKYLQASPIKIPGIIGPNPAVNNFKDAWIKIIHASSELKMNMKVYMLTKVELYNAASGFFRPAKLEDLPLVCKWMGKFILSASEQGPVNKQEIKEAISQGDYFLWEDDGQPVSMAKKARQTKHGYVISAVYTPPKFRNKGYAKSCVGALCQNILDSGKTFCALFTDLSNPTSNSIYQKLGFKPLCDFSHYIFKG